MRRKPIHRGGIVSAGYDPVTRALDIEFDTKRVLRYENVGNEVAERFLCSAEPLSYYPRCHRRRVFGNRTLVKGSR